MNYDIISKLTNINLTPSNRGIGTIKYIVVHYVGAVSTALNNVLYYSNNYVGASAHYFCDKTSIYQSVSDKDIAWHCGTKNGYKHPYCRNSNSIGIEMCLEKDGSIHQETLNRTYWLIRELMKKYKIPLENVVRHYDVTGKLCPAPYVDNTKWQKFKIAIFEEEDKNKVKFNYKGKTFKLDGFMKDNSNYVKARELLVNMGYKVDWDSATKTIIIE